MTRASTVVRRGMIVAFLVLIWLRPAFGAEDLVSEKTELAVLLVVDRTKSMDATDVDGGARFDRARADLDTLIESLPAVSFSIVSFATEATVELPATADRMQAHRVLDGLSLENPLDAGGSSLELPLRKVQATLAKLRAADPDRRVVLVLASDGEATTPPGTDARPEIRDYTGLAAEIDDGAVLGYGTAAGATMALKRGGDLSGGYVPDRSTGLPAVSRLDQRHLTMVADDLDVPYVHRDRPAGIATVVARLSDGISSGSGRAASDRELTWVFALALLALVVVELRSAWRGLLAARRDRRAKP